MTAPTTDTAPQGAPEPIARPSSTDDAISQARQRLAEGRSLVDPAGDTAAPTPGPEAGAPDDLTVTLDGLEERGEDVLAVEVQRHPYSPTEWKGSS